ncbi:CCDC85 family [Popillia japonica]|uniref:CCDC85 family n=1 Tax=Popillia japonica TaxID=7064 RepID=A0AAW1I9H7_POPJA
MSNKKQPQYVVKEAGNSVPPRYQPPPQPTINPGILKHTTSTKDVKQYASSTAKDAAKFYPGVVNQGNKPYLPYPYPQIIGVSQGRRSQEEDGRTQVIVHHQKLEENGIPPNQLIQHPDLRQHRQPVRYPEEEFLRPEMLKFVRKSDGADPTRLVNDQNRHMQNLVVELRSLKEANQRLADDNQELRDLCCFLDDDRQKGRKLAREWQRFGRYTASVMRQEVSAYQSKLRELDNKQQELIKDNLELKELCLYLDEERGGNAICPSCGSSSAGNLRDDGDGSSSSTNADEPAVPQQFTTGTNPPRRSASRERLLHENLARQRSTFNDQIMQYVRNLEQRVKQLEDDKRTLTHKINQLAASTGDPNIAIPPDSSVGALSGRPEAVVRALQVLEVREQLEREGRMPDRGENISVTAPGDMDDGEKALVREMCNVVWRKLEEGPQTRR